MDLTTTVPCAQMRILAYLVCCNNYAFLFYAPCIPIDLRVELVVPPLPALLANAPREECGNEAPLALTILLNKPARQQLYQHRRAEQDQVETCLTTHRASCERHAVKEWRKLLRWYGRPQFTTIMFTDTMLRYRCVGACFVQQGRKGAGLLHEGGIFIRAPAATHFSDPVSSLAAALALPITAVVVFIAIQMSRSKGAPRGLGSRQVTRALAFWEGLLQSTSRGCAKHIHAPADQTTDA